MKYTVFSIEPDLTVVVGVRDVRDNLAPWIHGKVKIDVEYIIHPMSTASAGGGHIVRVERLVGGKVRDDGGMFIGPYVERLFTYADEYHSLPFFGKNVVRCPLLLKCAPCRDRSAGIQVGDGVQWSEQVSARQVVKAVMMDLGPLR